MSRVVFYDKFEPKPAHEAPSLVEVERIYCFDFDGFSAGEWSRLLTIYRTLPGE